MTTTWQQQIIQDSDADLWRKLTGKLDAVLDPSIRHPALMEAYYLPLFFYLYKQVTCSGRRGFVAGINAPQGGGKSTLTSYLVQLFGWSGLKAVTLSIDDFYLTHAQQVQLGADYAVNPYLQQRGYPGTHDIELGREILSRLKRDTAGSLALPRYDKSRHQGQGDRAGRAQWPIIQLPVDVILFEGWMLGFQPLPAEHITDPHLAQINTLLSKYDQWHRLLDAFVYLYPDNPGYVIEWRSEAEERMKSAGLAGMSARQVREYAEKFIPAYRLYGPQLAENPPTPQAFLTVRIGRDRLPAVTG